MKNINKLFFGIITLWAILATIFGFYDLTISKYATTYKDLQIFEFGNDYGNHFDEPLLYVSITILLGSIFNDIKMQRKVGFLMILYSFVYLQYISLISNESEIFISNLIIIFQITFFLLTYNKNWRNYVPIAISMILLYFFTNVIVHIMKIQWGRVRYTDLSSESEFTAWYVINGPDTANSSFPSSHTASAFTFLPILIMLNSKKMSNKLKIILVLSVVGFGFYVALGRVVVGKHYASNVLFSAGLCAILTVGFYKLFSTLDLNNKVNNINPMNKLPEVVYSDLTNQWLGCYYNQRGRKFWKWFNSYDEAINYTPTI